jgi:hypothetical protein
MRLLIVACAALVASQIPAVAQSSRVLWKGGITWTGKSAGCVNAWTFLNEHAIARFRPSGLGTNGTNSTFSIFYSSYAAGYRVPGRFDNTLKQGEALDVGGGMGTWPVRVRFTSQVPAVISASTPQITINGQIVGFDYTPGCTATFRMALLRDLDN